MKNTWKRISALCLSLVMVALLLPVSPAEAAISDTLAEGIVLYEDDFSKYSKLSEITDQNVYSTDYSNGVEIVDDNGENVLKCGRTDSATRNDTRHIRLTIPVNIPSYEGMTFRLKLEADIKADTDTNTVKKNYLFGLNNCLDLDGNKISIAAPTEGSFIGTTAGDDYETVTQYYDLASNMGELSLRIGCSNNSGYGVATYIKGFRVTLLPVETSNGASLNSAMAEGGLYAKLSGDATVEEDMLLNANAVLDLNGYNLTVNGNVDAAATAKIVDNSANKSGKLSVGKGTLTFDAGAANGGQLPVWAGDGYIFVKPKLNEDAERAFFVEGSKSADGFTLDFRPGFGEAGGLNVREQYLAQGQSGITMTANLSWTDIYGDSPEAVPLVCNDIFNGMYETEFHRGRLKLTGAEKYESISVGITLSSCGVSYSFEPLTFDNTYVTKHFVTNFDNGQPAEITVGRGTFADGVLTSATTSGRDDSSHVITLNSPITTGAGKKLVIEYKVKSTNGNANHVIRFTPYEVSPEFVSTRSTLLGLGMSANADGYDKFAVVSDGTGLLDTAEYVTVREEIDLQTGYTYLYIGGTLHSRFNTDGATNLDATLDGVNVINLYVAGNNSGLQHTFDNFLVYTVS